MLARLDLHTSAGLKGIIFHLVASFQISKPWYITLRTVKRYIDTRRLYQHRDFLHVTIVIDVCPHVYSIRKSPRLPETTSRLPRPGIYKAKSYDIERNDLEDQKLVPGEGLAEKIPPRHRLVHLKSRSRAVVSRKS